MQDPNIVANLIVVRGAETTAVRLDQVVEGRNYFVVVVLGQVWAWKWVLVTCAVGDKSGDILDQ
jgi:hypothetical protein